MMLSQRSRRALEAAGAEPACCSEGSPTVQGIVSLASGKTFVRPRSSYLVRARARCRRRRARGRAALWRSLARRRRGPAARAGADAPRRRPGAPRGARGGPGGRRVRGARHQLPLWPQPAGDRRGEQHRRAGRPRRARRGAVRPAGCRRRRQQHRPRPAAGALPRRRCCGGRRGAPTPCRTRPQRAQRRAGGRPGAARGGALPAGEERLPHIPRRGRAAADPGRARAAAVAVHDLRRHQGRPRELHHVARRAGPRVRRARPARAVGGRNPACRACPGGGGRTAAAAGSAPAGRARQACWCSPATWSRRSRRRCWRRPSRSCRGPSGTRSRRRRARAARRSARSGTSARRADVHGALSACAHGQAGLPAPACPPVHAHLFYPAACHPDGGAARAQCSKFHSGRAILLGDSAHAVTSTLGQARRRASCAPPATVPAKQQRP